MLEFQTILIGLFLQIIGDQIVITIAAGLVQCFGGIATLRVATHDAERRGTAPMTAPDCDGLTPES